MARLKDMTGHQKDACDDETAYVLKKYRHHLWSNSEHNQEGSRDHIEKKRIFTLTSCNFCI